MSIIKKALSLLSSPKNEAATQEMAQKLAHFEYLATNKQMFITEYPYPAARRNWLGKPAIDKLTGILRGNEEQYKELLRQFASFNEKLAQIPLHQDTVNSMRPYWLNGSFPGLDAISVYGFLATHNPQHFVEVGSGNSTKFARKAIEDHGLRTKIISIDPFPLVNIDSISDTIIRKSFEEVGQEFFSDLTAEDILFIDNSHRAMPGSDVTVFFTEVLGMLPKGMIYGMHDIFLPEDYPEAWNHLFYSEQYLLACYLLGGADGDQILFPSLYIFRNKELLSLLTPIFEIPVLQGIEQHGGMFWLQKA